MGESTQGNVEIVEARLAAFTRQQRLSKDAFSIRTKAINSRNGTLGLDVNLSTTTKVKNMDSLISGLLSNNVSIYSIIRQIARENDFLSELIAADDDPEMIKFIRGEIRRLEVESEFLKSQLELTARNKWLSFLYTQAQYDLAEEMRPLLILQLELIDTIYSLGEISTVEKLTKQLDVQEKLYNADMAAIALAISIAELDAMMEGVVT